jgi:hypothetical protein
VRHLLPADRARLRSTALCLVRAQRSHDLSLPQPIIQRLLLAAAGTRLLQKRAALTSQCMWSGGSPASARMVAVGVRRSRPTRRRWRCCRVLSAPPWFPQAPQHIPWPSSSAGAAAQSASK